ncbi:MAG TPA: ornithine cyclodeaminase family protein [Virgibacillus sp.]|nr:ornithine cyclodeaminase family protein [Virgibacillus sp.]
MLILSEKEIMSNYFMKDAIKDMRAGLSAKNKGLIENPQRIVIDVPEYQASSLNMPSADLSNNMFAMKVVTIFPENPSIGKPTTQGVLLLSDATTGEHKCIMNASFLTRLRTGALSGIATDKLARTNSRVLGVIGTGGMAFEQVLGVLEVREFDSIVLFNRTEAKAHTFKKNLKDYGVKTNITVVDDVTKVVTQSDVICSATRSNDPVFNGADLKKGTHINGVGSYLPNMREVDLMTIKKASKIVVDDLASVKEEAGELIHADETGEWSFAHVYGELRDIHERDGLVRENPNEITFFKCVGTAYFDLVVAIGIYKKAIELGIGQTIEL